MDYINDSSSLQLIMQNAHSAEFVDFIEKQSISFFSHPQTQDGKTLIHQIAYLDLDSLFKLLLRQLRAKCSLKQINKIVNCKDHHGNLPIFYAAFRGNLQIIKCLIDNGSSIDSVNTIGMSIMHFAAQGDQPNVIIYFREKYRQDIHQLDHQGSIPLHYACSQGSLKALNFLLSWTKMIDIKNTLNETPLYLALFTERSHMIHKLLKKGADPTIQCVEGKSIIQIAKENTRFNSLYKLILDVNQSTKCLNSLDTKQIYSPQSFTFLIISIFLINTLIILPIINSYYHTVMFFFLVSSLIVFFVYISMSDSGISKDTCLMSWLDLVELNANINSMCPYCKVKKEIHMKHCFICNHCIQGFDHHCNWINNCIGKGNRIEFIFFLILVIINLTYGYYIGYEFYCVDITISYIKSMLIMISIILMTINLLLCIPVTYILLNQMKKALLN